MSFYKLYFKVSCLALVITLMWAGLDAVLLNEIHPFTYWFHSWCISSVVAMWSVALFGEDNR